MLLKTQLIHLTKENKKIKKHLKWHNYKPKTKGVDCGDVKCESTWSVKLEWSSHFYNIISLTLISLQCN